MGADFFFYPRGLKLGCVLISSWTTFQAPKFAVILVSVLNVTVEHSGYIRLFVWVIKKQIYCIYLTLYSRICSLQAWESQRILLKLVYE